MKRIICLLMVCTICCVSCRKDKETIKGEWRWSVTAVNGFIEEIVMPDAGSVVTLSLDANSRYTTWLNNEITHQGRYSITPGNSMPAVIHFDKDISTDKLLIHQDEMFSFSADSLTLFDNYFAGTSYYFIKVH